jgi:DNA processing protein
MSTGLERERWCRAALCQLTEPGDPLVARLLPEIGGTRLYDLLRNPDGDVRTAEMQRDVAARLARIDPDRILETADRCGLRFIIPGDEEWPAAMDDLVHAGEVQQRSGAPIGLWVRGPLHLATALDRTVAVAIVGCRDATQYGAEIAAEIGATCARTGMTVVSGAALGIDAYGHRGALAVEGPTVAVLSSGADRAYPLEHTGLIDRIAAEGAVVSEAVPGAAPTRMRFLARNRMIAAMARGTVVVEAAVRSGSLNTANWADRLNRHVMGVPGPVTSAQSEGVHRLLRTGATVVTRGADVLEVLGASGEHLDPVLLAPARARDQLSARERQILDAVPLVNPVDTLAVARLAALRVQMVASALHRFAALGLVERVPGGWLLTPEAARA